MMMHGLANFKLDVNIQNLSETSSYKDKYVLILLSFGTKI